MSAAYPSAIKSFTAINRGVTVLTQALFDDAIAEVEAIEATLGLNVHGRSGSLSERVKLAMDYDGGGPGHVEMVNATDAQRVRFRCGVTHIDASTLTGKPTGGPFRCGQGTITFPVPLTSNATMLLELQLTESDPALDNIASFVWWAPNHSSTGFTYQVATKTRTIPDPGTSFILHWIAFENAANGNAGF